MADQSFWDIVPFGIWTATAFAFGCIVGSFLNVCIYRIPRGESVVSPPSHCPHCGYSIPWYLNVPLVTWLWLGGKCANCKAPISIRYFLVELLTGIAFAACWISSSHLSGHVSPWLPLVYFILLSGLIAATFIDIEHLIVPDVFTFGGMAAGLICSFLVPQIQISFPLLTHLNSHGAGLRSSIIGLAAGAGLIYAIVRLGKIFLGRQKIKLPPATRIIFTETCVQWPDMEIPYEELFYRKTDTIELQAARVETIDRCYLATPVRLTANRLQIGSDTYDPEKVPWLEAVGDQIVLPREAMGFGDVTFMAAIGAFLGCPAVVFSFVMSCFVGSFVGCALILFNRKDWASRIPYVPYIAVGALIWIFGGSKWLPLILPLH
jgi:leader peptidase (prepilin peptidase) / N-methyltransferase